MKKVIEKIENVILQALPQLKDLDNIIVTKQHTKTLGMHLSEDNLDELLQHVTKSDFEEKLRDGFEKIMIEEKLQWDDVIDFEVGDDLGTITQPNEVFIHIKFQSDTEPEFTFVNVKQKDSTKHTYTEYTFDKALILSSAIRNFRKVNILAEDVVELASKYGIDYTLDLSKVVLNLQSSDTSGAYDLESLMKFLDTVDKLNYRNE